MQAVPRSPGRGFTGAGRYALANHLAGIGSSSVAGDFNFGHFGYGAGGGRNDGCANGNRQYTAACQIALYAQLLPCLVKLLWKWGTLPLVPPGEIPYFLMALVLLLMSLGMILLIRRMAQREDGLMSAQWQNKLATVLLWLAGFLIIGILAAFLGYMLYKGLPVLSFDFIFGKPSDITAGGGVGPQFFNTFYILGLSHALFSAFSGGGRHLSGRVCRE